MPDIFQYRSPWKGTNVSEPEVNLEPGDTPYSNNFDYVLGELRTRQSFNLNFPYPGVHGVPGGEFIRTFFSFRDPTFTNRLAVITKGNLYSYSGGVYTLINPVVGEYFPLVPTFYNGVMYFPANTNLYSWDGTTFAVASNIMGGKFVGELANHVVVLNTAEAGPLYFPQRVRWSASGLPTQFNPAINTNAGYVDLDIPDAISGFAPMGVIGWIMRTDGITQMIPTGNGISPFEFLPLLSAPVGVGNYYPWSLDTSGLMCAFASRDDIYLGNPQGLQPIGGKARETIYADIANATSPANVSPYIDNSGVTTSAFPVIVGSLLTNTAMSSNKFNNLSGYYILAIPQGGFSSSTKTGYTVFWKYDLRSQTWLRWTTSPGSYWLTSNIRTVFDSSVPVLYRLAGYFTVSPPS